MADLTPDQLQSFLHWYPATVERIVDGDTVDGVAFDLGFGLFLTGHSCRLYGIDTPETGKAKSDYERTAGENAKAFVKAWFAAHPNLIVHTDKPLPDDFGRWLVTVYSAKTGQCLNDYLVAQGLAVASPNGKTKWRDSHPTPTSKEK